MTIIRSPFQSPNPFQRIPLPVPVEGWDLRAPDIFRPKPLASQIERNAGWLQARHRTTSQIQSALFPQFSLCGMQADEVRSLLNCALWDAGYAPSRSDDSNPTWTWNEGN